MQAKIWDLFTNINLIKRNSCTKFFLIKLVAFTEFILKNRLFHNFSFYKKDIFLYEALSQNSLKKLIFILRFKKENFNKCTKPFERTNFSLSGTENTSYYYKISSKAAKSCNFQSSRTCYLHLMKKD